ncbi:hypothetical protein, partial [Ramlibacter sp.]|uniref:hypothetical protein n=1 Tax=Ramlibacter sp. TaxID=1917967 RepID=UPI002BD0114C
AASISVEVSIEQDGSVARTEFEAPSAGLLRLGRRVAGISIDVEATDVELGTGDQLELVAPVFISARKLQLACNQIVVRGDSTVIEDGTVILESEEVEADPSLSTPLVRHGARLQVSWPNATSYPWTTFSAPAAQNENPKTADALRALRRLTLAFRSHSKGQLARYKGKIEHQRMMKGDTGRAVLKQLMEDEVVSLKGPMYFLDPDALGAKVGAAFVDIKLKRFSDKTREYVQRVISQ